MLSANLRTLVSEISYYVSTTDMASFENYELKNWYVYIQNSRLWDINEWTMQYELWKGEDMPLYENLNMPSMRVSTLLRYLLTYLLTWLVAARRAAETEKWRDAWWRTRQSFETACRADVVTRVARYLSATVSRALPMGFGRRRRATEGNTARNRLGRFIHQPRRTTERRGRTGSRERGANGRAVWGQGDGGPNVSADWTAQNLSFSRK